MKEGKDELLTVVEVAHYLRVPVSWVYKRTRNREIPIRKLGGHIRIPRSELLAWVEAEGSEGRNQ
ncbi:MAG: helix-turn-helix domain-containing protein [Chloroflexi bacterium]|jgi:excisionase family DNA binding protein|nr:helix-turn-helix domain-containing protein [Chloroflexota bacterium]